MANSLPQFLIFSRSADHIFFNLTGIAVSLYALYVEIRKHRDPKYVAMCDLGEHMSCSRVLTSEYSKGFGIVHLLVGKDSFLNTPNCVLGIIFFALQLVAGFIEASWAYKMLFYTSAVSCVGCLYLAYVLFFILKDLCLVCISMYVVNAGLLYLNYFRYVGL